MSDIHVRTLLEALDKPSTLKALVRKTGYPTHRVLQYLEEARSAGDIIITAVPREGEPTYYERVNE